jgi:DHA2 family multidrug resistance protein
MLLLGTGLALIYVGLDQGNRSTGSNRAPSTCLIAGGVALVVGFLINEAVVADPWASPTVLKSRNIILVLMTLVAYMATSLSNTMLVPGFLAAVGQFRPDRSATCCSSTRPCR